MYEHEKIVAEIHRLIDEQMQALEGKLSAEEARAYAERSEKLQELVVLLSSATP